MKLSEKNPLPNWLIYSNKKEHYKQCMKRELFSKLNEFVLMYGRECWVWDRQNNKGMTAVKMKLFLEKYSFVGPVLGIIWYVYNYIKNA